MVFCEFIILNVDQPIWYYCVCILAVFMMSQWFFEDTPTPGLFPIVHMNREYTQRIAWFVDPITIFRRHNTYERRDHCFLMLCQQRIEKEAAQRKEEVG